MVLKKKWPALLLIVCLVVCLAACSGNPEPAPEEGAAVAQSEPEESAAAEEGAEETPSLSQNEAGVYEIDSAADFVAFAQLLKEETLAGIGEGRLMHDAALTADIDLSEAIAQDSDLLPLGGPYMVEIDGEERQMQAAFCGEFNGNGHTISGIQLDTSERGDAGLFSLVYNWDDTPQTKIHDLTIADSSFMGLRYAGAFAGTASRNAILENCVTAESVSVTTTEGAAGGIVGYASDGDLLLRACENYGTISGEWAGGIAGAAESYSYLVQCNNYGVVTGENAAGIIARHAGSSYYDGLVLAFINYGTVKAEEGGLACGIVAANGSTLRYCVNAGLVDGGETGEAYAVGKKDGSMYCSGNIGTVSSSNPYVYQYGFSWDLGTYEGLSEEALAGVQGYTGKALMGVDIEFTPLPVSAAADGSLTAVLQGNGEYGYWQQGNEGFPVWDEQGGLDDYPWLQELLSAE